MTVTRKEVAHGQEEAQEGRQGQALLTIRYHHGLTWWFQTSGMSRSVDLPDADFDRLVAVVDTR